MNRKYIELIIILCLGFTNSYSQVTIGSSEVPNKGSLLDIKNIKGAKGGENATGGLLLPRVQLVNLKPVSDAEFSESIGGTGNWERLDHIGLIVYNVKEREDNKGAYPGIHIWSGEEWAPIIPYSLVETSKTVVSRDIKIEHSRAFANDPVNYPLGYLGQFTDIRGPNGLEVNKYYYTRYYAFRVDATGTTTYKGVRNPYSCESGEPIVEIWTEPETRFTYIDDGVWMSENINTEYQTATSLSKMSKSSINNFSNPQYSNPVNTNANTAQVKQNGLLYNWAAATNMKGGGTGKENEDGTIEESHKLHKNRQGICPDGWHLPSDKEWNELERIYATEAGQFTETPPLIFQWPTSYNTEEGLRPFAGFPGHGQSMKSRLSLINNSTEGNSKTASLGGFNVLSTGVVKDNTISSYGIQAGFWTSSSYSTQDAWNREFANNVKGIYRGHGVRTSSFSVRCKRN